MLVVQLVEQPLGVRQRDPRVIDTFFCLPSTIVSVNAVRLGRGRFFWQKHVKLQKDPLKEFSITLWDLKIFAIMTCVSVNQQTQPERHFQPT